MLLAAWATLSVLTAVLLFGAQRQAKDDVETRFGERATLAARFTETYTRDLLSQERRVATRELAGRRVTIDDYERTNNLLGYQAAVLLDSRGRALRLLPHKRELIGTDLASQYAHLGQAAAGHTAISKVVPSASRGCSRRRVRHPLSLHRWPARVQRRVPGRDHADRRLPPSCDVDPRGARVPGRQHRRAHRLQPQRPHEEEDDTRGRPEAGRESWPVRRPARRPPAISTPAARSGALPGD